MNNLKENIMSVNFLQIESDLIANFNSYAQGLDTKDWSMVRNCFADGVFIDYGEISAPTGDPLVQRRADDWLLNLQMAINGFDMTKHFITNHRVVYNDNQVSCSAYLVADHVIFANPEISIVGPDEVATVIGEYTNYYELVDDQWKICKSELDVHWSRGNIDLFGQAVAKAMGQL
ncbi:MAG: hypothetical protein ACJAYG_001842 [Oceanicoccus sp.]